MTSIYVKCVLLCRKPVIGAYGGDAAFAALTAY